MKLLFLDRDGTLMEDVGYPRDPETVRLLPGAAEGVREVCERWGYEPIIVSNQSGVGRGWISHDEYRAVHERFIERFQKASGLKLTAYYCLHGPDDDCECRKPKPGLLKQAISERSGSLESAIMIGDKPSDIEAGNAIGANSILIIDGDWKPVLESIESHHR